MLPDQVLALAAAAFPGQVLAEVGPTEGGFSHYTALASIGARRCAIKAASAAAKRDDVRHEARILALLGGRGLPCPQLLALSENNEWTVAVSAAIGGRAGIGLYQRADLLAPAYRELGQLLAAIHRSPIAPPSRDFLLGQRFSLVQQQLPTLGLGTELHEVFAASLAHPAWRPASARLVHGDAGLHNVLWDDRITALLDWEWSGWGNPLLDIAWAFWTMRWRAVEPALWDIFFDGYRAACGGAALAEAASLRALVFGQIAGILARVRDQPAARAEWLRRANWTLALEFDTPRL